MFKVPQAALCLHYLQCFIAKEGVTYLVLAGPSFRESVHKKCVEMVHCGGGRKGRGGFAVREKVVDIDRVPYFHQ